MWMLALFSDGEYSEQVQDDMEWKLQEECVEMERKLQEERAEMERKLQ